LLSWFHISRMIIIDLVSDRKKNAPTVVFTIGAFRIIFRV